MCLGIPMKIVEILDRFNARAETMGVKRAVRIELVPGVKEGDFVLVHAGFAMEIIDQNDAQERIEIFEEMLSGLGEREK